MAPTTILPAAETIPAPAIFFHILNLFTFMLHILFVNVVLGGIILLLGERAGQRTSILLTPTFISPMNRKLPIILALAINLGVAPLLFVQVLYGQFVYTSSVLMAVFWILIIPLLLLAYYSTYINQSLVKRRTWPATAALIFALVFILYIAFMFTQNMTLMLQPEAWAAYFTNPGGTLLRFNEPTLWPRYLHFITASVAIGSLFSALVWWFRNRRHPHSKASGFISRGLLIFAFAGIVQMAIGVWFLLSLPEGFMFEFMGRNLFYTIILTAGILLALGAVASAFRRKLWLTVTHLLLVVAMMVITRANLRDLYLRPYFERQALEVMPQTTTKILFLVIFVVGLASVGVMLYLANAAAKRRASA